MIPWTDFEVTLDRNPKVKSIVWEDLNKIFHAGVGNPAVQEIILWGSYSFGEGKYNSLIGEPKLISDYDVFIVINSISTQKAKKIKQQFLSLSLHTRLDIKVVYLPIRLLQRPIEGRVLFSRLSKKGCCIVESSIRHPYNQLITLKTVSFSLVKSNPISGLIDSALIKSLLPLISLLNGNPSPKFCYQANLDRLVKTKILTVDEKRLFEKQLVENKPLDKISWSISTKLINKVMKQMTRRGALTCFSIKYINGLLRFFIEYLICRKPGNLRRFAWNPYHKTLMADMKFLLSVSPSGKIVRKNLLESLHYVNMFLKRPISETLGNDALFEKVHAELLQINRISIHITGVNI